MKALIVAAAILLTASTAAHATRTGIDIMLINPASPEMTVAAYDNDTRQWVMRYGICEFEFECLYNGYSSTGVWPGGDYEHDDWVHMADRSLVYFAAERHGATFNDHEIGSPFLWNGASVGHYFSYCMVGVDSGCNNPRQVAEPGPGQLVMLGAALIALRKGIKHVAK